MKSVYGVVITFLIVLLSVFIGDSFAADKDRALLNKMMDFGVSIEDTGDYFDPYPPEVVAKFPVYDDKNADEIKDLLPPSWLDVVKHPNKFGKIEKIEYEISYL